MNMTIVVPYSLKLVNVSSLHLFIQVLRAAPNYPRAGHAYASTIHTYNFDDNVVANLDTFH